MSSTSNFFVHPTAIVESGVQIGEGTKIWHHCHIRNGASVGKGVSLGKDVYIDSGVQLGDHSRIQNGVSVYKGVHVGAWCFIGPQVVLTNDIIPRAGVKAWNIIETFLEDGASIGAGAVIRCGIRLGAFCMVGAGAVVTHSVEPFTLAMGIPAKPAARICACGRTQTAFESQPAVRVLPCCKEILHVEALAVAQAFDF